MDQYMGETIRSMTIRMKEHIHYTRDSRIDLLAVAEHAIVNGHGIDWATAKVIDSAKTTQARKVEDILHIARKEPKMKKNQGMIPSASLHRVIATLYCMPPSDMRTNVSIVRYKWRLLCQFNRILEEGRSSGGRNVDNLVVNFSPK